MIIIHYHPNIYLISLVRRKIVVCPRDDLQTFYPSEGVGRSKLIQTNSTEPNVDPFIHLTH